MEMQHLSNYSLGRQFMWYVPLNVLGMLALSCYILADTFFVANGVGTDGLTALNLVMPVYSLISGLGLLFGMGGATKYAICHGAHKTEQANKYFTLTILLCIGTGVIIMLTGAFFAQDICILLGADSTIVPLAEEYLQTIMLFAAAFIANNALICFVRNDGSPHLSMLAMVIGSLSNVFLDYLFIFIMEMGMFGAAIATCMAPLISMAILAVHLFSRNNRMGLTRGGVSLGRIGKIISIGFSAFVTEFSAGLVILVFNFIILTLTGNIGVAAYGVVANLSLFSIAIFAGISEGVQPLISNAYGAGDKNSLGRVFRWAILLATAIGIVLSLLFFGFAEPLANAFNRDNSPILTQLTTQGIRLYFPLLFLSGINIVTASLLASILKAGASFLISSLRAFIFVTVFVFFLSKIWGITGVWLTMPCTELLTFIVSLMFLKRIKTSHLS